MKIDVGKGYGVYFTQRGDVLVIILCGGDKSTQSEDIKRAKAASVPAPSVQAFLLPLDGRKLAASTIIENKIACKKFKQNCSFGRQFKQFCIFLASDHSAKLLS